MSDAAVIGNTFPLEALVGVSGLAREQVERILSGLVRREVISLRADPLSPERGQYAFVQTMLRQVAYDTLSRRERKSRHLAVSDHLSRAFSDGGEEVSEVIANHLLDALAAVPGRPLTSSELRARAIATLVRAAERAHRTGAPDTAAAPDGDGGRPAGGVRALAEDVLAAARLWERAGEAAAPSCSVRRRRASTSGRAAELYRASSCHATPPVPTSASPRASGGQVATTRPARSSSSRSPCSRRSRAATPPRPSTSSPSSPRCSVRTMPSGWRARRSTSAQSLDLPDDVLAEMLTTRGIAEMVRGTHRQAAASLREAARLARGRQNHLGSGRALLNLSDGLAGVDPAAAAEVGLRGALRSPARRHERDCSPSRWATTAAH